MNAAKEAQSADDYAITSGTELPFEDASFDLVMAYNVLMDVEDVSATLIEIKRVLRPAGTLVISIVHPFSDRGRFAGTGPSAPFVLEGAYFPGNASKALKNAMACGCTSLVGLSPWRPTRLR
jgi:ubiquinone/menaquinone biosynthesis C-methylase UbiE